MINILYNKIINTYKLLEWYRGCYFNNKQSKIGIFPKSFVKIFNPKSLMHP